MIDHEQVNGAALGQATMFFVSGALMGVAAGLLLAPKSGRETREQLKGVLQKTKDNLRHFKEKAREKVEAVV